MNRWQRIFKEKYEVIIWLKPWAKLWKCMGGRAYWGGKWTLQFPNTLLYFISWEAERLNGLYLLNFSMQHVPWIISVGSNATASLLKDTCTIMLSGGFSFTLYSNNDHSSGPGSKHSYNNTIQQCDSDAWIQKGVKASIVFPCISGGFGSGPECLQRWLRAIILLRTDRENEALGSLTALPRCGVLAGMQFKTPASQPCKLFSGPSPYHSFHCGFLHELLVTPVRVVPIHEEEKGLILPLLGLGP